MVLGPAEPMRTESVLTAGRPAGAGAAGPLAGTVPRARDSLLRDPCTLSRGAELTQFSSGYTVGPDGNRYVFTMNKERYPDFAGLVAGLHRAGIKVVPNIKPCECWLD